MERYRYKFSLSIGYDTAVQEEIVDLTDYFELEDIHYAIKQGKLNDLVD